MLEVNNLKVEFVRNGKRVAPVDGVSFSVGANETVGLLGESGCGKSVTALSILRLFPLASKAQLSGTINYNDGIAANNLLEADDATLRGMRGKEIAMIFQEPMTSLIPCIASVISCARCCACIAISTANRSTRKSSPCCNAWVCRAPSNWSTTTRTACPAACASV